MLWIARNGAGNTLWGGLGNLEGNAVERKSKLDFQGKKAQLKNGVHNAGEGVGGLVLPALLPGGVLELAQEII